MADNADSRPPAKRSNPYVQVALTYLRRAVRSFQAWVWFFVLLTVIFLLSPSDVADSGRALPGSFFMWFFGIAIVLANLTAHVAEQFASARARLTPHFRRVHATVAAAAAIAFAIILPSLLAWRSGLTPWGLLALTTALFSVILWCALRTSNWVNQLLTTACFVAFVAAMTSDPVSRCLNQLLSGERETEAVVLFAVSAALCVLGGLRIIRTNEETPEYHRWQRLARKSQTTGQQYEDAPQLPFKLTDRLAERRAARLTGHARRASASRWSRIWRWQTERAVGPSAWLWGVAAVLLLQFMEYYEHQAAPSPNILFFFLLTFLPAFIPVAKWDQGKRYAAWELSLPIDRRAYFKQLGAAAAISQFHLWLVMGVTAALCLLINVRGQGALGVVAGDLTISALCQVWLFGGMVWLAKCEDWFVGVAVAVPVVLVPVILLSAGHYASREDWNLVLPAAIIFAGLGLLVAWSAYRGWLAADFD
jgi:hypothetical protein